MTLPKPSQQSVPPPSLPRPKHRWRLFWRTLLVLLLLAAIFHRPLIHWGARLVLIKLAATQHLAVDVHFSGSIWTNFILENARVRPLGDAPTPVARIDIERLRLDYSLPILLKKGPGEFLQSYEIKNADLAFVAVPSRTEGERKRKRSIAETLNNILAQPAAYSDRVRIENFNIDIQTPGGNVEVRGADVLLDPEKFGHFRIAAVRIPNVPPWENLAAQTSYAGRNFFLRDLVIAPEIVVEEANFDASQRAQNKGSIMVKGRFFGGTAQASLEGTQLKKKGENLARSYDTTFRLDAAGISLADLFAYLGKPAPPVARVESLAVLFRGEPENPQTWDGNAYARVAALALGKVSLDNVEANVGFKDGKARIDWIKAAQDKNEVRLTGSAELPASINEFQSSQVAAMLEVRVPDLAGLTAPLPQVFSGALTGGGPVTLAANKLTGDFSLTTATGIQNPTMAMGPGGFQLSVTLPVEPRTPPPPAGSPPPPPKAPVIEKLGAILKADLKALRFKTFAADSAKIDAVLEGGVLKLGRLELVREKNAIAAYGTYRIPLNKEDAPAAPIEGGFKIDAPQIEAFGIAIKDAVLSGHLAGEGNLRFVDKTLNGRIQLGGGDFQLGEFKAAKLDIKVEAIDNEAIIEALTLQIAGSEQIAAAGKVTLKAPFIYEGGAIVSVKDLSIFNPILQVLGVRESIQGGLQVDWNAKSEALPDSATGAQTLSQTGDLAVALTKARYGKFDLNAFNLAGIYGPGFAQSTDFHVVSGPTDLTAALEWREGKLRVRDIALKQGKATVLTGFVIVPVNPADLKAPIPFEEHLAANLSIKDLDLEPLLTSLGQNAPASGIFNANLLASGTPLRPSVHLKVNGTKIKAKAVPQLDAAQLDVAVHYFKNELSLDASLRQALLQPLTLKGRAPIDIGAALQQKKLDPDLPIELALKLPASSLVGIAKLSPAVRRVEGTAAIDVRVGGTLGKPAFSGSAQVNVQSARLANEGVPSIGGFQANLVFAENALNFKTFRGEIGGGTFDLGGRVLFPTIKEPLFDLKLRAKDVLVRRDDSITIRVDSDLKLTGPLNTATAAGTVFVTNSRFFREIDILPIGLPGRPKPKPRAAPSKKTVSFDKPPLRDWTFDIAIKTRKDDPFRIRGNLANGSAAVDMKFAGTGLTPSLDGVITIENFEASLPFSKLTVTRGFIYFRPEAPFEPLLDLQAQSTLRDTRVDAYVYGNAKDPQVTLTSEPPLPQSDIVSLLATGTTAEELTGNSDVLASRAAVLVFQQLYRKVFKKRDVPEEQSLRDRFDLDVGAVDNRTGRQEISARFKLNEQLYLIGDVDVTGNFTGRLRYLLRFR